MQKRVTSSDVIVKIFSKNCSKLEGSTINENDEFRDPKHNFETFCLARSAGGFQKKVIANDKYEFPNHKVSLKAFYICIDFL